MRRTCNTPYCGWISILAGTCKTMDGPYPFGTYLWAKFDDLSAWERKLIGGPYIHHRTGTIPCSLAPDRHSGRVRFRQQHGFQHAVYQPAISIGVQSGAGTGAFCGTANHWRVDWQYDLCEQHGRGVRYGRNLRQGGTHHLRQAADEKTGTCYTSSEGKWLRWTSWRRLRC